MKTYGLTGGIGMGKSAAGKLLRERGVRVLDTDEVARHLVEPGQPALEEILKAFGPDLADANGHLRRKDLARLVFGDATARRRLEEILHPRIRDVWRQQVEAWRVEGCARAVVVIPLLYETDAGSLFDAVVCVACSAGTQRERLQERGWDARQIQRRLDSQWPVEKKMELADYVVWNEGGLEILDTQLKRVIP